MTVTPLLIEAIKEQKFDSFEDWLHGATRALAARDWSKPRAPYVTPSDEDRAICFDTKGRVCKMGKDFMRARDECTFPVHYIWPEQLKIFVDSIGKIEQGALKN